MRYRLAPRKSEDHPPLFGPGPILFTLSGPFCTRGHVVLWGTNDASDLLLGIHGSDATVAPLDDCASQNFDHNMSTHTWIDEQGVLLS